MSLSFLLAFFSFSFAGIVEQNGRLIAQGNKITSEKTREAIQLKGPSMQWSVTGWGSDKFFITETVDAMVDGWNAQILRVPLGLSVPCDKDPNGCFETGYDFLPEENWNRVKTVADAAIAKDIYVIVDWHSHYAHLQTDAAIDFFTNANLAGKYGNIPNVIFEIYNEPTDTVSWQEVKTYSNAVIRAIRDKGFNNLILVGNPYWDTSLDIAANDPPTDSGNNYALVFHFYASAHRIGSNRYFDPKIKYRDVIQNTLDKNIPVFVSEWGTNDAQQFGKSNFAETDKWHAFLDSNKISSCAWGVTAGNYYGENVLDYWSRWGNPLHYNTGDLKNWTDPYRMTAHGRYIYKWLTGKDTTHVPETSWPTYNGKSSSLMPDISEWWVQNDNDNGGTSSITDAKIKEDAVYFSYTLGKGTYQYEPYVGASFPVNGLSECGYGISYLYKGAAHTLRAEQSDVRDYDYHINYKSTQKTDNWTQVVVPWGFMWQSLWGVEVLRDSSKVKNLTWNISASTNETGEIYIKDIKCLEDGGAEIVPIRSRQPVLRGGASLKLKSSVNGFIKAEINEVFVFNLNGILIGKGKQVEVPSGVYLVKDF